jgi:hypothetical protein
MKRIKMLFSATILMSAIVALSSFAPLPPGPSSNGQGSLTRPGDLQRRFAYHANTMPDGSVQGSGVLTITEGAAQIKFDINCMTISGNTATMSGVVTSVSGATPFQEGWNCWFSVKDNGEGSNSNTDQITLLFGAPTPLPCTQTISLAYNNIEGGNIQVKP